MDFERLFEDEFNRVFGYLARRVGSAEARDLAAEVFTRAYAGRKRFDPARAAPRAWLFGIAQNVLRRHYRDEERRLRALARLGAEAGIIGAQSEVSREEPRLAQALIDLEREERDVLLLFAWAELSYDEIAAALDVPAGTVRSRLHRARSHVRAALTREEVLHG